MNSKNRQSKNVVIIGVSWLSLSGLERDSPWRKNIDKYRRIRKLSLVTSRDAVVTTDYRTIRILRLPQVFDVFCYLKVFERSSISCSRRSYGKQPHLLCLMPRLGGTFIPVQGVPRVSSDAGYRRIVTQAHIIRLIGLSLFILWVICTKTL